MQLFEWKNILFGAYKNNKVLSYISTNSRKFVGFIKMHFITMDRSFMYYFFSKFILYYFYPCILHVIRIPTQIKIKIKTFIVYMKSINMCVHIIRLICHENEMRNSKNAPQIPKLRQSTKV